MSTRLYSQYDVLMVLIPLIDSKPWVSTNPATGLLEKYDGTKRVQYTEQLCIAEGNCWISILSLIMSEEVRRGSYDLTPFRTNTILKLRRHLTESVIHQIPQLEVLKRFVEELNVSTSIVGGFITRGRASDAPSLSPFAIMAVERSLYETLQTVAVTLSAIDEGDLLRISGALAAAMEKSVECYEEGEKTRTDSDSLHCKVCLSPGEHRCSNCRKIVYCSRECQLKDWQSHKLDCMGSA